MHKKWLSMLYNPIFGTFTATMLRRQLRANDYRHC
uniref:Uncharacterized protein n=1 Tax=Ackermannviridae sp. TaxID=2831612 RepID=A0A8S5VPY1_9CAUD|nr:MAG TPA: hypothetical protein [Ackermannviridae sp.]